MFLLNSRLSLFTAASNSSGCVNHHHQRHPFSRSYGAILQSSLARVSLSALRFSRCPPVSVYSTGSYVLTLEAFLGSVGSIPSALTCSASHLRYSQTDFPIWPPYMLALGQPSPSVSTLLRPSITIHNWCRNINLLSIRLRL